MQVSSDMRRIHHVCHLTPPTSVSPQPFIFVFDVQAASLLTALPALIEQALGLRDIAAPTKPYSL